MSFKEIHIQSHDGEEKYMCTSCNRKFATEVHLNMHLSAHNEPRQVSSIFYDELLNNSLKSFERFLLKRGCVT